MTAGLRGAVIAFAIAVYGFQAAPLPRNIKKGQFDSEIGVEELGRWVGVLGAVGVRTDREALGERAYAVGRVISDARKAALKPFQPWFRLTGTGQGWGLFTYPDSWPHRLVVEIERGATWELIYAGLDAEHAWRREQLAYRRVRGVYDGQTTKPGKGWENLTVWIARRAFEDFGDATRARTGFVRFHTRSPGDATEAHTTEEPTRRHFREWTRAEVAG